MFTGVQFDSEQLAWAAEVVRRRVPPTPQYAWPLLAEAVGAEVWVKHENHTPTGAFKVRGGLVYAERLRAERPQVMGIISATRGNHGQSLAFAGTAVGVNVTIVVPEGNSRDKNAATQAFGAELIVNGHDFQAAREHAAALADLSVTAGRVVATETAATFVDGVACRVPDPEAIAVIVKGASEILTVTEDEAAEAMRVLYAATHNVAEPAGALALAGLLQDRSRMSGKRVGIIHTGGNADSTVLVQVLGGQTPAA